jgi:hypothetical protein
MTLDEWKKQSPNNTRGNTLIEGIDENGRIYYRWNLLPTDPTEKAFYPENQTK